MDYKNSQTAFQCISFLLSYPNTEWRDGLEDCLDIVKRIEDSQISSTLQNFIDELSILKPEELIESYVYTFDFGKKTNLYITYMNTGEQRERGAELIELKAAYSDAGFQVTDKELPDYLPLMLEFASVADENFVLPILKRYQRNFQEIHNQLKNNASIYSTLFDCFFQVTDKLAIRHN